MENTHTEKTVKSKQGKNNKFIKPKRKYVWKNKPDYAEIFRKRKIMRIIKESETNNNENINI